jgi:hypothetical protein
MVGDGSRVKTCRMNVHLEVGLVGHELLGLCEVNEGANSSCKEFVKFLGCFERGPGVLAGKEEGGGPVGVGDWARAE